MNKIPEYDELYTQMKDVMARDDRDAFDRFVDEVYAKGHRDGSLDASKQVAEQLAAQGNNVTLIVNE